MIRGQYGGPRSPGARAVVLCIALTLATTPALAAGSAAAGITFLWLALILLAARLALVVERFGMPGVLGELLVGIVLGNLSLLGIGLFERIEQDPVIAIFAEIGVVVLLLQVGLETNLEALRAVGARALAVAVIGVVVPFALGWFIGPMLVPGLSSQAALFLGAALTATSVGITARVFRDLGRLQEAEARIILGAAVIDDVLGLVILAVVSGIVERGSIAPMEVGWIVVKAAAFLVGAIVIGRLIGPSLARALAAVSAGIAMKTSLILIAGLALAWLAHHLGLAAIVGAFAAGLLVEPVLLRPFDPPDVDRAIRPLLGSVSEPQASTIRAVLDHESAVHHRSLVEPVGFFVVPIFFVFTGMQVKLEAFTNWTVLGAALALTAIAILGKLVAGWGAGRVDRLQVGIGMVPRGEVGLIFAAVGQQLGVISPALFSMIILMVILTTLLTPPLLAWRIARRDGKSPHS